LLRISWARDRKKVDEGHIISVDSERRGSKRWSSVEQGNGYSSVFRVLD